MPKRLTPCDRLLIIEAIRDKLVILDGITQRKRNPLLAHLASDYRAILDILLATWRTQ